MTLTKTFLILATAGFLAACEQGATSTAGGEMAATGETDTTLIRDAGLMGKLDSATMSGNAVVYSYFTDVISDTQVLNGSDIYCGGPGQAVIQLTRGNKDGRGYNAMAFTCR